MKKVYFLFLLLVSACGGGGGGVDYGGNACNSLNARVINKVFGGESCNQNARTPVVFLELMSNDQVIGICTGSLITIDDVLTSAHCLNNREINGINVYIGGKEGELISAVRGDMHPFYRGEIGSPYDIGIVTLARVPNPPVGPIPILLSTLTQPGQDFSTFGYGKSENNNYAELRSVELTINSFDRAGNIIASLEDKNASICSGDSGGPIVQVVNGVTSLIGVNSYVTGTQQSCVSDPSIYSGFVDLQYQDIIDYIGAMAPDFSAN